nr:transcriptional regulator GcvA [Xanthobacter tagetidis]
MPSMRALQAFEAAARHLNFTRAAVELNLTQTAISHQIRNLEETLDIQLFSRDGGRLRLTAAGEQYVAAARLVISEISLATDRASHEQRDDTLTIGCLGTFEIKSLLPHISEFQEKHPDLSLRFKTIIPNAPPARPDYDVSIQYGVGDWPGMTAYKLGEEEVFPVCSPRLLEKDPDLTAPADLARHTIIRTGSPLLVRDDWPFWLDRAGVPGLAFAREITCDLLYPAFQAAIEGLGIVMGRSAVVRHDISRGLLVEPFSIRLHSPSAYYLVVPQARENLAKVEVFRDWVLNALLRKIA